MKAKYIHSLKLAAHIMNQGCPIKGVKNDIKNPNMDIYIFEDCEKVNNAIKTYKKS